MTIKYFSTSTCTPCKAFTPVFNSVVAELGVEYNKIDASLQPALASQYNVTQVPTLIFEKNGEVVFRHTGVMSRVQLQNNIQRFI